jgi:hypothetical protein
MKFEINTLQDELKVNVLQKLYDKLNLEQLETLTNQL